MARSFKRKSSMSAIAEPNVTPLIDLAFSLLIIFMITTPLLEQTIPVELPIQEGASPPGPGDLIHRIVTIVGEGTYDWDGRAVSSSELADILRQLPNKDRTAIHIRADRRLPYQEVVTLIDLVQRHNLTRFSLDTAVGGT